MPKLPIYIIGTSHVATQSTTEIKQAILAQKPDIIAVELDLQRAAALFQEQKNRISLSDAMQIGIKGFLFAKIGQFIQQKIGKAANLAPGSDMKTAIELARTNQTQVAFIDQPIQITLRRISEKFTWKEKGRFCIDVVKGLFFPKKQMRLLGLENFNLQKVPEQEIVHKMVGYLQQRYPSLYATLVEERNKYMVKQLIKILRNNPGKKILVIVGAAHKEGMQQMLLKVDLV